MNEKDIKNIISEDEQIESETFHQHKHYLWAFHGKIFGKTLLDATIKLQQIKDKDIFGKLDFISRETSAARKELNKLIPTDTIEYNGEIYEEPIMEAEELECIIEKAIEEYMVAIDGRYPQPQIEELFEFKGIANLARMLNFLMQKLIYTSSVDRRKVMADLLKIADASIEKLAELWSRWRYEAEEISHNLPFGEIIEKIHQEGYSNLDDAVKLMLPEVVAACLVHLREIELFIYRLELELDGVDIEAKERDREFLYIIEDLNRNSIIDKYLPLKDNLVSIYNEMVLTGYDINFL